MTNRIADVDDLEFQKGQIRVIGLAGQRKLRRSRVVVIGTGRVGGSIVIALHAAGVGVIDCIDPQRIENEQIGPFFFAQMADVGKPKAAVLARFLNRRGIGRVNDVCAGVESIGLNRIRQTSLVISCANTIPARIIAERKAILAGVPILQVAAFDGREQLGGMITIRRPMNPHLACYACLAQKDTMVADGRDGLFTPVTATLGNMAAHLATLLLSGCHGRDVLEHNVFILDLERLQTERIAILRRSNCEVCGG